jgi:hypothetical protein
MGAFPDRLSYTTEVPVPRITDRQSQRDISNHAVTARGRARLVALVLSLGLPVTLSAHDPDAQEGHEESCTEATCRINTGSFASLYSFASAASSSGVSLKLSLVGTYDLRAPVIGTLGGFIGDLTVYDDLAILGSRRLGVFIIDVSNPTLPVLLSNALDHVPAGTFPPDADFEDVAASRIGERDVLVVGLQGSVGARGIALFDITNPLMPALLSEFPVPGDGGVHELDVGKVADGRTLAFLGALDQETFTSTPRLGDTFIVDISDPENPTQLAEWGFRDEPALGDALAGTILGLGGNVHGAHHSARMSADGERLYVSHWDGGFITLDIADPANPLFIGRILEFEERVPALEPDINAHSVAEAFGGRVLLTAQEYHSDSAWGKLRLWDVSAPENPVFLSEFGSDAPFDAIGSRTVHNPEVVGNLVYTSWSSDGFRVIDIADTAQPKEVASFKSNTVIQTPEDTPIDYIWGVRPEGNLVFLSNGYFGLQVLSARYFTGFLSPVDDSLLNPAKAGQTVALKWLLTGANDGAPITNLSTVAVTTIGIDCNDRSILAGNPVPEPASGFQNLGDGYYQYNWKTTKGYAGTCRRIQVDLGGGASHTADFQFK